VAAARNSGVMKSAKNGNVAAAAGINSASENIE
jgi:hypothetical protein